MAKKIKDFEHFTSMELMQSGYDRTDRTDISPFKEMQKTQPIHEKKTRACLQKISSYLHWMVVESFLYPALNID